MTPDYIEQVTEAVRKGIETSEVGKRHRLRCKHISPVLVNVPNTCAAFQVDGALPDVPTLIVVIT